MNDKRFSVWWVDQRMQFRAKSRRELFAELREKGINGSIIETVLEESGIDEFAAANRLITKKKYLWKNLDEYKSRIKMSNYLARHGFGWETIRMILKKN